MKIYENSEPTFSQENHPTHFDKNLNNHHTIILLKKHETDWKYTQFPLQHSKILSMTKDRNLHWAYPLSLLFLKQEYSTIVKNWPHRFLQIGTLNQITDRSTEFTVIYWIS